MEGTWAAALDLEALQQQLRTKRLGRAPGWSNELWDSIDSTNSRAAELLGEGCPEGVIVMARQQTAGRGRQGRVWVSPPDSGIYASFVLRPQFQASVLPFFTLAGGVAAARAVRDCLGVNIGLKWVNDLVFEGRKVGGILAEIPSLPPNAEGKRDPALVFGIGINVRLEEQQIPDEIRDRVNWLERLVGRPVDANQILAAFALHFEDLIDAIGEGKGSEIINEWKRHSVTLGRTIRATSGVTVVEGVAVDLTPAGGLIIEKADGERVTVHAGEVTIRGADGSYS